MNSNAKKIILSILVFLAILIIAALIYVIVKTNVRDVQENIITQGNIEQNDIVEETIEETKSEEKVEEKNEDNTENKVATNTVSELSNTETKVEDSDKEIKEEENNEQKAIDIAKKDWGTDSSVYFYSEGKNKKGEYIISVRKRENSEAISWYRVNVSTGSFTSE